MPIPQSYNADLYSESLALGQISGRQTFLQRALLTNLLAATPQTVWPQGGNYTYLTSEVEMFISSSSASDTTQVIRVIGLDSQFNEVTTTMTLNGQTQVSLGVDLFRINDMVQLSGDPLQGNVYAAPSTPLTGGVPTDPTQIKSIISLDTLMNETGAYASNAASQVGVYTVPKGQTLLITDITASSTAGAGFVSGRLRLEGNDFFSGRNPVRIAAILGDVVSEEFQPPLRIPEGTDFEYRVIGTDTAMINIRTHGYLVRN